MNETLPPPMHDERDFLQWRDETAAHFDELAALTEARAKIVPAYRLKRRASALRKLARMLRAELP